MKQKTKLSYQVYVTDGDAFSGEYFISKKLLQPLG